MRKRPTLTIVLVALSLGLFLLVILSEGYWDGAANATFPTTVYNAVSGKPIAGARIARVDRRRESLMGYSSGGRNNPLYVTDTAGFTQAIWSFGASGRFTLLWRTGSVGFRSWDLEVSAPGYETLVAPLSDHTGETRAIWRSMSIPITVQLNPIAGGTTSQASP